MKPQEWADKIGTLVERYVGKFNDDLSARIKAVEDREDVKEMQEFFDEIAKAEFADVESTHG